MAKSGNGSWIARCKAYMKQHGCQLGEAMKALSNKNKGKGKSFRGGNAGVAANAEAFEGQQGQGAASHLSSNAPPSNTANNAPPPPPHPTDPPAAAAGGSALESLGGLFEVGATPTKVMDGGRKRTQKKRRGGRKVKKSRSRSRSRSRHHRHRSRRGGSSSLSFSEYN